MAIEDKLVNLKDLKVVKDKIDDDVANLKSAIDSSIDMTNTVDHLLNYAYKFGDKKSYNTSSTSIEIERYGTKIIADGNNGSSTTNIRFKLNNELAYASSNAAIDSWADPVSGLKAGHKYKVSLRLISGNVSREEGTYYPSPTVYKAGYHATILQNGERGENGIDYSGTFVAESGVSYHFAFVFTAQSSATNAIYQYIVEDITEKTADLLGTIQYAEGSAWA